MFGRHASSTASVLRSFILPGLGAAATKCAYTAIQMVRDMEASGMKDMVKDHFSHASSTVSAFIISHEAYQLISTLMAEGMWSRLNNQERIVILVAAGLGVAGSAISMTNFGIEHSTLTAGLSGAAGALLFNVATTATMFIAKNRIPYNPLMEDGQSLSLNAAAQSVS